MARQGRVRSETGIYHVLLRGVETLFDNETDYAQMYDILRKYAKEGQFRLISYALLKNRVHIVLNTLGADIGIALKPVCTSYARYYNRAHGVDGKLFYDRFKSEPVNSVEELRGVSAFINAAALRENAIRASLFEDGEKICEYISDGLNESEFKATKITAVFLEDYECLSHDAIDGIIYALTGVMPKDFAELSNTEQDEAFARLTEKRWMARTKLYEILEVRKPVSAKSVSRKSEDKKEEKPEEKQKNSLSVWLL